MPSPTLSFDYGLAPNNITLSLKQTEGATPLTPNDAQIVELMQLIHGFHTLVNLKKIDFFIDADLGANMYRYKLDQWGRKWNQILLITQPDITFQDFGSDGWMLSEINHIRNIRALIVKLVLNSGLTEITGRW